jgi:hypothetical protein
LPRAAASARRWRSRAFLIDPREKDLTLLRRNINHVDSRHVDGVGMLAMEKVPELFDRLGGPSEVARILKCGTSTASEMKRRSSIPVRYWPMLIESEKGREIGLSWETLGRANLSKESAA